MKNLLVSFGVLYKVFTELINGEKLFTGGGGGGGLLFLSCCRGGLAVNLRLTLFTTQKMKPSNVNA